MTIDSDGMPVLPGDPEFKPDPRYPKNDLNQIPLYGVRWSWHGGRKGGNAYLDKDVAIKLGKRLQAKGYDIEFSTMYIGGTIKL